MTSPLGSFHPVVQEWFGRTFGTPTPVQVDAWAAIARGEHVLATAPTGSGKTLAAFLWALNQLITGAWPTGATRVLYVSPLKALNNDVRRNLIGPLESLQQAFGEAGMETPGVRVLTRSGDTVQRDREHMLRHPPEILITTPESLNLLLTSSRARMNLDSIAQVILDEVHAVAGNKRGTHLITAVDRLVLLSGEFQRIAMSASVKPLAAVAEFVGGYTLDAVDPEPVYTPRPVRIVEAPSTKRYALHVACPEEGDGDDTLWPSLTRLFKERLAGNRSTLLFVNSRRLCERITSMLNDGEAELIAYPHHGSLSRELRLLVEQRLKSGELKAIVATSSLELGIDIGELDEVLMVQTPFNVVSALQRVGRAGHRVGAESAGVLYPTHGMDFLHAAVMTRCILDQDIESLCPVSAPLDVLTQIITSMAIAETWNLDALFAFLQTSAPYRHLTRTQFDLVIEMLAGRYRDTRIRSLEPIATVDRIEGTIAARDRARPLISMSGGTIPDRGYFELRREDDGAKLGELDEEFVWERTLGHVIAFGNRTWTIRTITDNEVLVAPSARGAGEVPFWKADESDASNHFATRVAEFLENADRSLDNAAFRDALQSRHCMSDAAADSLIAFLKRQRGATGKPLPHRRHVMVEHFEDERDPSDTRQIILHTLWGGSVNRPFALALSQAYEEQFGVPLETFSTNESVVAILPHDVDGQALFALVSPAALEPLLRAKLERTGYFGARFRENAGRALLLPRRGFRKRMPLWMNRLRARKLMETIARYTDFPILLETWRTCLRDIFELDVLAERLDAIATGAIAVSDCRTTAPSPFAAGVVWRQTNKHMYELDGALEGGPSRLDADLIREAVHTAALRPSIPNAVAETFTRKLQRTFPGYAPESARDLVDWVRERRFIPAKEWDALRSAMDEETAGRADALIEEAAGKLAQLRGFEAVLGVAAADDTAQTLGAWATSSVHAQLLNGGAVPRLGKDGAAPAISEWLSDWLRFYGPIDISGVRDALPIDGDTVSSAIEHLVASRLLIDGALVAGAAETQVCDTENLERLLRITRRAATVTDARIPVTQLPLRLAMLHGLPTRDTDLDSAIERLLGYPLQAAAIEGAILPARINDYRPEHLDAALSETGVVWYGCGDKRVALGLQGAMRLFQAPAKTGADAKSLFPDAAARYSFSGLMDRTGMDSPSLTEALWSGVWQGRISNESFDALRQGLNSRFRPPQLPKRTQRITRGARHRWKLGRPESGHWFAIPEAGEPADALEQEEEAMERARILLGRYGVVFRSLLAKEIAPFRWSDVFGALRRMELAGEILAGNFIEGVGELQFATPEFADHLEHTPRDDQVYWCNATDPVSLCGVNLPDLKPHLPRRLLGTTLVYRGTDLVIVSERNGASLNIRLDCADPRLPMCLSFLEELAAARGTGLRIREINGAKAPTSPYAALFAEAFEVERGPSDLLILGGVRRRADVNDR